MAIVTHMCPHCLTDHVGLRTVAVTPLQEHKYTVHLVCPKCKLPCGATMDLPDSRGHSTDLFELSQHEDDLGADGWRIVQFWPAIPRAQIPELLPKDIKRIYLQAERNFQIEGNEEAAGTM
jgi:hypothetical protein